MSTGTPWTPPGEPASTRRAGETLMLVEGHSFFLSDTNGDVALGTPHGLYVGDTRFCSRLELRVNGQPLEGLASTSDEAFAGEVVLRSRPQPTEAHSDLLVVRRRYLGLGLREDIEVRSFAEQRVAVLVSLFVDADFADLFAVKEGRRGRNGERTLHIGREVLALDASYDGVHRGVELSFHGPGVSVDTIGALWRFTIDPGERVDLCWDAAVSFGTGFLSRHSTCKEPPDRMTAVQRAASWDAEVPVLGSADPRLLGAVNRSLDDLGSLRLFDPTQQRRPTVAAGAPWFMTVFGRDSLLTSWMALPTGSDLALGTLELLAALQGRSTDPERDEEPGRVLHELRFSTASTLSLVAGDPYYGTADAAPLFVMLLAEAARWGAPMEEVRSLLPAADAALAWIRDHGDRDRDGFVEYLRATPRGLANQGWKDSWDGIRYQDGRVAAAPLALCEVQAYVYGAYVARADLARWTGDVGAEHDWATAAVLLRQRFHESFWLDDRSCFAVALDGDKRPVDSITSNPGHALWTGIVDEDLAPRLAATLIGDGMWSGWGVRTLAEDEGGYNPMSYHCGSVWPHDNGLLVAGLARYGEVEAAHRVANALLDVADHWDGRLPELFCGVARDEVAVPVTYPTSCWPQAWAAATPLLLLRSLLGLQPSWPDGVIRVEPALPVSWGEVRWRGIPVGGHRVDVVALGRDLVDVRGLPAGVRIETG